MCGSKSLISFYGDYHPLIPKNIYPFPSRHFSIFQNFHPILNKRERDREGGTCMWKTLLSCLLKFVILFYFLSLVPASPQGLVDIFFVILRWYGLDPGSGIELTALICRLVNGNNLFGVPFRYKVELTINKKRVTWWLLWWSYSLTCEHSFFDLWTFFLCT